MQQVKRHFSSLFVPSPPPLSSSSLSLQQASSLLSLFISTHSPKLGLLTGAGISTASGIPCYRGELGSYSKGHEPVQHSDFIRNPSKRARFWARSLRGFRYFANRQPTATHHLLSKLESVSAISGIVTQNVDRLHHKAGSINVVELHGRGDVVACINTECTFREPRTTFTESMEEMNQEWMKKNGLVQIQLSGGEEGEEGGGGEDIRADGDAHISLDDYDDFVVPSCHKCGGTIMPELTFFGGSIQPEIKDSAARIIDEADALLILGTSAHVYSAYRLVRSASLAKKPIMMVNIGETRVDDMVDIKIEHALDDVLQQSVEDYLSKTGYR